MSTLNAEARPTSTGSDGLAGRLKQDGCGSIPFAETHNAFHERHLVFDNILDPAPAGPRERSQACARSVRDVLSQRWVLIKFINNLASMIDGVPASTAD